MTKLTPVNAYLQVDGYRSLTADELDYYLYTYGSVMTCMKWKGLLDAIEIE